MKFKISRDKFFETLQNVIGVVPTKTTMPILQNVKLYTEDGLLKMMATDIEIMLVGWAPAEIIDEGSTTIPARTLFDIVRELPATELEIEVDEFERALIKTQFGHYKLSGQDAAEFPQLPVIESQADLIFDNDVLYKIIDKTLFTCGHDELRPAMNGVLVNAENGSITAVSTDSHRMSKYVITNDTLKEINMKALIPTRTLNFLIRLLEGEGTSTVYLGEQHILFNVNDTLVYSRLIYKDSFPDYNRVLPTEFIHSLKANKDELVASIKRVKIFSSKLTHQIYFTVTASSMEISAEDIDFGGEGREKIDVEFDGENYYIAYNANYLLEILQHIEGDEVIFAISGHNAPTIIRSAEEVEGEDYMVLIMPVEVTTAN